MDCAKREGLETAPTGAATPAPAGASDVFVILVTGSRHAKVDPHRAFIWSKLDAAAEENNYHDRPVVVRHGAAPGVDEIAANIAASWGWGVESYPARWGYCGPDCPEGLNHQRERDDGTRYCPLAGTVRNKLMVDSLPRPNVVVGFPDVQAYVPRSGTWHCLHYAIKRGLFIASITGLRITKTNPGRRPAWSRPAQRPLFS